MLNQLITFIIVILLAGCVVMAVQWFLNLLVIPQPFKNIIMIILGLIGLVWLLQFLGLYTFSL